MSIGFIKIFCLLQASQPGLVDSIKAIFLLAYLNIAQSIKAVIVLQNKASPQWVISVVGGPTISRSTVPSITEVVIINE